MLQVNGFHPGLCRRLETLFLSEEGAAEIESAVRKVTTELLPTDPVRVSDLLIALRDEYAASFVAIVGQDKADRLVRILQALGIVTA